MARLWLTNDVQNATSDRLKSARSELAVVEKEIKELTISSTSVSHKLTTLLYANRVITAQEGTQAIEAIFE